MSAYHFISGLPRSGSTLLSALLRQNPKFTAGVTSPVAGLVQTLLPRISGGGEFAPFFDDDRRRRLLHGVFDNYYGERRGSHVVFDTNRSWTGKAPLLRALWPEARIICLVREVGWVIDSIERILRRNPLRLSRTLNFQTGSSVYARAEVLMNSDAGLIGQAWSALREAWFSEFAPMLIIIDYERLARDPLEVLSRLYDVLGEPAFRHDTENLAFDEPDYDDGLGMPGLHKVRPKVGAEPRQPCIPPDLFAQYADTNFWARPEMNSRRVKIL